MAPALSSPLLQNRILEKISPVRNVWTPIPDRVPRGGLGGVAVTLRFQLQAYPVSIPVSCLSEDRLVDTSYFFVVLFFGSGYEGGFLSHEGM